MTICRLKPDHNVCCSCIDAQVDTGEKKDCNTCPEFSWVELLQLGATIFGRDYAFVTGPTTNWTIEKVDAKRIGCCTYISDACGHHDISIKNAQLKAACGMSL